MVSANDGKVALNDGVIEYVRGGKDSVTVIDLREDHPKIVAELEVPNSVISPPSNVAISPDGSIILVASARKYEGDPPKQISDDRLTVIDLRVHSRDGAPAVSTTLKVGKGPAGVAINRSATLALTANRDEGSISLIRLATQKLISKVSLGDDKAGPSAAAFTPDGTRALVTLYGVGAVPTGTKVAILRIRDEKVELTDRLITTGLGPYGLDISRSGNIAVVANLGGGVTGDADVVSVIDLEQDPVRVVNAVSVAPSPEGIKLSPDARFLAVSSVNGTHKARSSAFYRDAGILQIYAVLGTRLEKIAEADSGHWCQGVAWSEDARRLYLQCMVEKEIQIFSFDPSEPANLQRMPSLKVNGGPAGLDVSYNRSR
jgi:DNA-binding beta-propeller fold protein YncE